MSAQILVVDDEKDVAFIMEKKLTRAGYTVRVANDGQKALNLAKQGDVDLIITDIIMPAMYKALKDDARTKDIPVIVLTGRIGMEESLSSVGIDRIITKPFDIEEDLLTMVQELIELTKDKNRKKRALVYSKHENIMDDMLPLLTEQCYQAFKASSGADFISKCLSHRPDIVFLDVLSEDVTCQEIIKAIKCFARLRNTKIIIFTYFEQKVLGDVDAIEQLKECKNVCMSAGATKYIGRFSRINFIGSIKEFLEY